MDRTRIVTPKDYTGFTTEELNNLVTLQEEALTIKQLQVEDAEKPYEEALEEAHRVQERLKAVGAILAQHKQEYARAELTLAKLRDMRDGVRGGLMYVKGHVEELKQAMDSAERNVGAKREYKWQEATIKELELVGKFVEVNKLYEMVLAANPNYKQSILSKTPKEQQSIKKNYVNSITSSARRVATSEENRKLSYYKGSIGLYEWLDDEGNPKPQFIAFTGGTYMDGQ